MSECVFCVEQFNQYNAFFFCVMIVIMTQPLISKTLIGGCLDRDIRNKNWHLKLKASVKRCVIELWLYENKSGLFCIPGGLQSGSLKHSRCDGGKQPCSYNWANQVNPQLIKCKRFKFCFCPPKRKKIACTTHNFPQRVFPQVFNGAKWKEGNRGSHLMSWEVTCLNIIYKADTFLKCNN